MAAAPAVAVSVAARKRRSTLPALCPSFAEVCSFLARYGAALDLPEISFPQMERYLRDTTTVPKPLVELHVKLLRKLGKSVTADRWEKYLAKVCQELNSTWAWELEQKGYQEMSMECKSSILKYLCECQFDDNLKFKAWVNEEEPEGMRGQPLGRDRQGLTYWLQLDPEQNIRLYTEEQDDPDGSSWTCIVRTRNDLAEALDILKSQLDPSQIQSKDQDQAGPKSPTQKETGNDTVEGTNPEPSRTTEEEHSDRKKTECVDEEKPLTQVLKLEQPHVNQENTTEAEGKEEKMETKDCKPPAFDNRVSTITPVIKAEPRDSDGPRNTVSVVMAPGGSVTNQEVNRVEEKVRSMQAKIPLKKRELKLAESYHSNHMNHSSNNSSSSSSSIIVCNPSVIQNKDREGKLPNPLASPSDSAVSQQQLVLTASRQELTNGRATILPTQKEPQNGGIGVIGQVGVIGHVGVIRSPTERRRASHTTEPPPQVNGPSTEQEKEAGRQSVLVRKGGVEGETLPVVTDFDIIPNTAMDADRKPPPAFLSFKSTQQVPEVGKGNVDPEPKRQTEREDREEEDQLDGGKKSVISHEERSENVDEEKTSKNIECDLPIKTEDQSKEDKCTLEKFEPESGSVASSVEQQDKKDQGLNGGAAAPEKQQQGPREKEKASSELQKEGIRLKIKIPAHKRSKLRGGRAAREEGKERETQEEEGRTLRRSTRICRPSPSPSSKASEREKLTKNQALTSKAGEEELDEEIEEEEVSSAAKKDIKTPAGLIRKQKGKRRHRRAKWTTIRAKRRKASDEPETDRRLRDESGVCSDSEESLKSTEEQLPSEDACSHCGLPNHPELILLCDSCDNGYHTACLRPPLMLIPDGQWFCPPCQHKLLCEKLEEQLQNLDSVLKKKERAERRRERLVYVGISVENIIPQEGDEEEEEEKSVKKKDSKKSKNLGRRSTRTRKHISYRFDDFDDAIDEAIEEDVGDICAGAERGQGLSTVLSEEGKRPIRSQAHAAQNRKRRRLNDLESDSTAAESEDDFMISNSSEDEEFAASGAEEEEEDEDAGSAAGSLDGRTRHRRTLKAPQKHRGVRGQKVKAMKGRPGRRPLTGRGRGRRRRSSEEEEDTEEDMNSDQISDMTNSEDEKQRRGLRRGQRQQVNYRETSESSDNSKASKASRASKASGTKGRAKGRGRPRKEPLSSDYSDVSRSSRESDEEEDFEEEDDRRTKLRRGRAEEEDERRNKMGEKRKRRYGESDEEDRDKRRRLKRTHREEDKEDPDKLGRGKRREMLLQQRRKRLAQMLKKRRPSTDEDESEDSNSESGSGSESSSEEDRPIRKRLNRIDSDDEEEQEEQEEQEEERTQKVLTKRSLSAEKTSDKDSREKGSLSPSDAHWTSRDGAGSPAPSSQDSDWLNGPHTHPQGQDKDKEDVSNSVQNSPQS